MSIINRITTWAAGQVLKSADLNGEFNNVINLFNNLDATTTTWTNVKVQNLTSTVTTVLVGTTTNDSAAAGNIGEYIESVVSAVNFPSTGVFGDATSISLTAGDWEVTAQWYYDPRGASHGGNTFIGISQTSGNSSTGLVSGSNQYNFTVSNGNTIYSGSISGYRQSLSSTTTLYLKYIDNYSVATPQLSARLSARRLR